MIIEQVHLENIKSYAHATARFYVGTSAICGPNGAGKTTLIEAIGFALFGHRRGRTEQLVRLGAQFGVIEVKFISSHDGSAYIVRRELRRSTGSTATLFSIELGAPVAQGVQEVSEQLPKHIGLRPGLKPETLFEGVVGVPQGLLTADFLLAPVPRKKRFEELLALQEFEAAFTALGSAFQWGRAENERLREKLSLLQEALAAKPELERQCQELQESIAKGSQRLLELQEAHAKAAAELAEMDDKSMALQRAREAAEVAKQQLRLAQQQQEHLEERYREVLQAAEVVQRAEQQYRGYLRCEELLQRLEQERRERQSLLEHLHELRVMLAQRKFQESSLQDQVLAAQNAAQLAEELWPLAQEEESLLEKRERLREGLAVARAAAERLREVELRLNAQREQLARLVAIDDEFRSTSKAAEGAATTRLQLQQRLAALQAKLEFLQARAEAQENAMHAAAQEQVAECPVCRRPFDAGGVEAFRAHLKKELVADRNAIALLNREARELQAAISRTASEESALKQRLSALEAARARKEALMDALAQSEQEAAALREQAAEEDKLLQELAQTESALSPVKGARGRWEQASALACQREQLQQQLKSIREQLTSLTAECSSVEQELARSAGVEEQLERVQRTLQSLREGYELYCRYAPVARELPERERALQAQKERTAALAVAAARAQAELEAAMRAYDAALHQAARERESLLRAEVARAEERLHSDRQMLRQLSGRLTELGRLEEQATVVAAELERKNRTLQLLAFLREAIREVGPRVARAILHRVSAAAQEIFHELTDDYALELIWGEDYGITVRRGAHSRDFAQLSGGEQMLAALAVRLALLREISDIGIAFFDEPTVNLDEEHRRSLAEQFRRIRGFSQLFVVSHDDSLEGVTDHVIRISKEAGVSRIEQA
jgi:exonuclease SbcC